MAFLSVATQGFASSGPGEAAHTGGWLLLDLVFADQAHAAAVLWGLGPDAEVVDPQTLRRTLADRAEQTRRRYDEG